MKTTERMTPSKASRPPRRFTIAQSGDGYEVVDNDGRPVTNAYPTANRPLVLAGRLNDAASKGGKSLARALGAIDADNDYVLPEEEVEALCL